jgi:hypothetical protein
MSQRPSGHARVRDDFYAEPAECTASLIEAFDWVRGGFHDPFAGTGGGTIEAAVRYDIAATGADLVDRAGGRFPVRDFFTDTAPYPNIVCNPPFKRAHEAIEYGLERLIAGGRIAVLADVNFLSAQKRYALHTRPEFEGALVLMKRPSCPPGGAFLAGAIKRGNGSSNYAWLIYQRGRRGGVATLTFAPPNNEVRGLPPRCVPRAFAVVTENTNAA